MEIKQVTAYLKSLFADFEFDELRLKWIKSTKERELGFSIGYYDGKPDFIRINGFGGGIVFWQVESILNKIAQKTKLQISNTSETIRIKFDKDFQFDNSFFSFHIRSESDFGYVGEQIRYLVNKGAIPFFDKYQSLEDVANLYATLEPEDASKYIQGMSLFMRVIMVLKLTGHKDYEQKRNEYHLYLTNYVKTDPSENGILKLFENTFYNTNGIT